MSDTACLSLSQVYLGAKYWGCREEVRCLDISCFHYCFVFRTQKSSQLRRSWEHLYRILHNHDHNRRSKLLDWKQWLCWDSFQIPSFSLIMLNEWHPATHMELQIACQENIVATNPMIIIFIAWFADYLCYVEETIHIHALQLLISFAHMLVIY